jgi:transposase InsO family protein
MTCRRILSDNGSAYRSGAWRKACRTMAIKPIRTKPYTPQTNGKAERFIKTLLNEWAYAMPFQTSEERNSWLPRYLGQMAPDGGQSPLMPPPLPRPRGTSAPLR